MIRSKKEIFEDAILELLNELQNDNIIEWYFDEITKNNFNDTYELKFFTRKSIHVIAEYFSKLKEKTHQYYNINLINVPKDISYSSSGLSRYKYLYPEQEILI